MLVVASIPTQIRPSNAGLGRVLQPFNDRTTWGGALHLLLGLPLGVVYFAFYLTGFVTGAGLSLVLIGLPLLFAVLASTRPVAAFEARLARSLTGVPVSDPAPVPAAAGALGRLGALLRDDMTWRRLVYLLSRFPLGIASFALAVLIVALPLGLIASAILYSTEPLEIVAWRVDTLPEALVAVVLGVLVGLRATCLLRIFGRLSGRYARLMLR
jgi:hypothetical protein